MDKLKVAIADDNKELVRTMVTYFERHPEIEVIWTAHNGKVCLSMLEEKSQMSYCLISSCHILTELQC